MSSKRLKRENAYQQPPKEKPLPEFEFIKETTHDSGVVFSRVAQIPPESSQIITYEFAGGEKREAEVIQTREGVMIMVGGNPHKVPDMGKQQIDDLAGAVIATLVKSDRSVVETAFRTQSPFYGFLVTAMAYDGPNNTLGRMHLTHIETATAYNRDSHGRVHVTVVGASQTEELLTAYHNKVDAFTHSVFLTTDDTEATPEVTQEVTPVLIDNTQSWEPQILTIPPAAFEIGRNNALVDKSGDVDINQMPDKIVLKPRSFRVMSNGTPSGTHVFETESGVEIGGVMEIHIEMKPHSLPLVHLTLVPAMIDIQGIEDIGQEPLF